MTKKRGHFALDLRAENGKIEKKGKVGEFSLVLSFKKGGQANNLVEYGGSRGIIR